MAQLISLILICLFFLLILISAEKYFGFEIAKQACLSVFLLICVFSCEFIYKSVFQGEAYTGSLFDFLESSPLYDGICSFFAKLLYDKTDILKVFIGVLCLVFSLKENENLLYYPLIFLAFSSGGVVLLLTMLAIKYEKNLAVSLTLAALAAIFDAYAAVVLVYIILNRTPIRKYAMYIYGAAAIVSGGILFAPAYACLLENAEDKLLKMCIRVISVILMGFSLVTLWR